MDYLPLRVMQNTKESIEKTQDEPFVWGHGFEAQKKVLLKFVDAFLHQKMDSNLIPEPEETYLKTILDMNFIKRKDRSEFEQIMANLMPTVMEMTGYSMQYLLQHPEIDLRTELRDMLVQVPLMDKWAVNKQVLKPDPTFAYHLIQTDKLRITKSMLEHLPFNHFYVDLEGCTNDDIFGAANGLFVNVIKIDEKQYSLSMYITTKDAMTFSYYTVLMFENTDKPIEVDTSFFREHEKAHILTTDKDKSDHDTMLKNRNIKVFILQLICYISIPESDVYVPSSTKATYHPNTEIKNKFREVFTQDVGVRVGSAIEKKRKEAINNYKNSDEYKASGSHKSPVAHFRCAHWHHYWTGKGRTELIVKWIEPTFVCGGSKDVTIHEVKGPKQKG